MIHSIDDKQKTIVDGLKERGYRMTLPRRVIIGTLAATDTFLSAEDIYHKLHTKHPGIGLATVYRTLVLFHQLGIVTKLEVGESKARFDLVDSQHHHLLVCESCHKIIKYSDFTTGEKDGFAALETIVARTYHFRINRHVVQYFGVCPECLAKEKKR